MAVSIKDIARVANVSYSTVSRALNDNPRVQAQTKARIQRIASEMGYLPSAVGRSLVTRRTRTIGIVVSTITDLFYAEVIDAIEETGFNHGYAVFLANSGGVPQRELAAIRALRERWVDGLIVVSCCSSKEELCAERVIDIPVVVINNAHRDHIGYSIEVDNVAGGQAATRHLLQLGHRRISHIVGPTTEWDAVERHSGYKQAMQAYGLTVDPALIVRGNSRPKGGIEAMKRLLALPAPPTAVFCYNDATALGAVRAARDAGLRIPQDLSVVGFDDIDLASYLEPPLTTVAQPRRAMGERAVEMILALLAGGPSVADCMLPGKLVVRGSTAALGQS